MKWLNLKPFSFCLHVIFFHSSHDVYFSADGRLNNQETKNLHCHVCESDDDTSECAIGNMARTRCPSHTHYCKSTVTYFISNKNDLNYRGEFNTITWKKSNWKLVLVDIVQYFTQLFYRRTFFQLNRNTNLEKLFESAEVIGSYQNAPIIDLDPLPEKKWNVKKLVIPMDATLDGVSWITTIWISKHKKRHLRQVSVAQNDKRPTCDQKGKGSLLHLNVHCI